MMLRLHYSMGFEADDAARKLREDGIEAFKLPMFCVVEVRVEPGRQVYANPRPVSIEVVA